MLRQRIGKRGEQRAESFLRERGLKCVTRNWRCRRGEIDLVMDDGESLVFVEVRMRGPGSYTDGVASVDAAKRRRLILAARDFLMRHAEHADRPCRFDVIGIGGEHNKIEWIPHAFEVE